MIGPAIGGPSTGTPMAESRSPQYTIQIGTKVKTSGTAFTNRHNPFTNKESEMMSSMSKLATDCKSMPANNHWFNLMKNIMELMHQASPMTPPSKTSTRSWTTIKIRMLRMSFSRRNFSSQTIQVVALTAFMQLQSNILKMRISSILRIS